MNVDLSLYVYWALQVLLSFVFGGLGGFFAYRLSLRFEKKIKVNDDEKAIEDIAPEETVTPPKIRDVIERAGGLFSLEPIVVTAREAAPSKVIGYLYVMKDSEAGQEYFSIFDKNMEIGRDDQCDISLNDVNVSRLHAMLFVRNDLVEIVDQASTNGTFVNGKRITVVTLLNENDLIQIGNTIFQYKVPAHEQIEPPTPEEAVQSNLTE